MAAIVRATRMLAIAVALVAAFPSGSTAANTGLVGHWRLDEGHGTVAADSSGFGDNGALHGGVAWVAGSSGSALSFDGSSGSVQVPNAPQLEPTSTVSVGVWVQRQGSPGDYRYILSKGASGCIAASYGIYSGPSGGLEFYISRQRGQIYARSADAGTRAWDGRWHLVVGTFDGTTIRLYVDGAEVGQGIQYPGRLDYMLPNSNDLYIGAYTGCGAKNFDGRIGDVSVWNQALTPAEISALTASPPNTPSPAGNPPTPPGQPPSGNGGSTPPPDQAHGAPALQSLRLSRSRFALSAGGVHSGLPPTISYSDSQDARTTLTIVELQRGVRAGRRCVAPRRNRKGTFGRGCTRYVLVGSFVHSDRAGRNRYLLVALRPLRLAPGSYLLKATPSARGKGGKTSTVTFTVIRPRR